jgi:eukaryotic-like serine/threonine-protein kinase
VTAAAEANVEIGTAFAHRLRVVETERMVPVDTGGRVGRFVLGRRLGAGGMGAVYETRDGNLTVAIKIPYCELLADNYAKRRFQSEGVAGSIVAHKNVARVLEHGIVDGLPYLVMDFVEGARLSTQRMPSLRRAAQITQQLLDGLGALHAANVVHGDVKTDNILIGRDLVKLIDFGLAHVNGEIPTEQLISGTPDYMAPEVIRGEGSTPQSDLYAAGVILYELLTGQTPFGGDESAQIVNRHLTERVIPPHLRRVDVEVPATLERIVMRALEKDPRDRITSAAAFSEALDLVMPGLDERVPTVRRQTRAGTTASYAPPNLARTLR